MSEAHGRFVVLIAQSRPNEDLIRHYGTSALHMYLGLVCNTFNSEGTNSRGPHPEVGDSPREGGTGSLPCKS